MQDHPFTANPAARLLDQDADLILLPTHPWGGPSANPVFPTIAAVAVAILLPLLAFGSIPQFFGRIILVAIVGGATALFASNASLGARYLTYPRDGWKCAGLYVLLSAISIREICYGFANLVIETAILDSCLLRLCYFEICHIFQILYPFSNSPSSSL